MIDNIKNWKGWSIWTNLDGWKYITVNLVGNLFPVWFLLIVEFGNNGLSKNGFCQTISQPYTYLILSIAFASSTLYLWIKRIKSENETEEVPKRKTSIGMIFYILILFPVIGFYLSKKECLEKFQFNQINDDCFRIVPVIYILFFIVVITYIYFQLKDFAELDKLENSSKANSPASVKSEIDKLNEDL